MVAIAGPSGSGKSTLLHILGTLDRAGPWPGPDERYRYHQSLARKLAAFRNKHIGFVFQFHHLLPEFSALENVCIPGWLAGRRKKEVEENAVRLLELLNLGQRLENKPVSSAEANSSAWPWPVR